jgi:hypothetical protein
MVVGKKIWLSADEKTLEQTVRNHVPVGSPVVDAKELLEFNGFECIYGMGTELEPENGWGTDQLGKNRLRKDGKYLICYLEISRLLEGKKYRLAMPYKNDAIINVYTQAQKWEL